MGDEREDVIGGYGSLPVHQDRFVGGGGIRDRLAGEYRSGRPSTALVDGREFEAKRASASLNQASDIYADALMAWAESNLTLPSRTVNNNAVTMMTSMEIVMATSDDFR